VEGFFEASLGYRPDEDVGHAGFEGMGGAVLRPGDADELGLLPVLVGAKRIESICLGRTRFEDDEVRIVLVEEMRNRVGMGSSDDLIEADLLNISAQGLAQARIFRGEDDG
jgi:hypothetical protein